jgi:hypothetical protein
VLRTIADTLFITFHPTDITPADDSFEAAEAAALLIEEQIIEKRENPYLPENKKKINLPPV